EAVALDTSFAAAWRILGLVYSNARLPRARQDTALARAYRFRDRLTEVDRLRTAGDYYVEGPGRDRGRGIAAEEEGLRRFPEGSGGYNNLALDRQGRREYARAESLLTRAIALDSSNPLATSSLVRTQLDLGRIDAATTTLATLRRRFPNTPGM